MHWMLWVWFGIAVEECWWPMLTSLKSFWTTMVIHLPLLLYLGVCQFHNVIWFKLMLIWLQLWTSLIPTKKAYGTEDDPEISFALCPLVMCQWFCLVFHFQFVYHKTGIVCVCYVAVNWVVSSFKWWLSSDVAHVKYIVTTSQCEAKVHLRYQLYHKMALKFTKYSYMLISYGFTHRNDWMKPSWASNLLQHI